jgi:microbial collagenase
MRHPSLRSRALAGGAASAAVLVGLLAGPALGSPAANGTRHISSSAAVASPSAPPPPTGLTVSGSEQAVDRSKPLPPSRLHPQTATVPSTHQATATHHAAAACAPADFGSKTGATLVAFVKASTTDCVNTLFSTTSADSYNVFREAQMVTIANAFGSAATTYPGDDSTSVWQLVLFLRAGYYVQYNDPTVGAYGATLATAVEGALDTYVAGSHFLDVDAANGDVLGDVMILTDSANEQARYLNTFKRVLNAYNSSFDAFYSMDAAVNDVYTPLFRGHYNSAFVTAVTSDPSIIDTLDSFALNHVSLLGGANSYLDSNAGTEMARFVQHAALQAKVRPLMKGLLNVSAITGPTAPLWVGVAEMGDSYDQSDCSYLNTCDLTNKITAATLTTTYTCDSGHTFRAEAALTNTALAAACTSVQGQDRYFHGIVKDSGPVANDNNANIEIDVFASRTDYQTYAGWLFGVDTNAGGEYLEGNPADPANQARFVAYVKSVNDGFPGDIWNLNHEYTHYLDGRYDMYGDFTAGQAVPDIWWIEGLAEYISYSYRGVANTTAISEAPSHTYALSTLWQTTYSNTNLDRTYAWGYLAVRYMIEKHPADVQSMLAKFRVGDYTGGYAAYNSTIGTRYDADFNMWLDACGAGACASGPAAAFDTSVAGLAVKLSDKSTDTSGTITARSWNFGDGTTSTAANPSKTYTTAGTYTITLTVTDDKGLTATTSKSVTVTGSLPACTAADTRQLGRNCSRSGRSATTGNLDYLYIYLPAGTTTLTVTTSGGTGNADLYYNPNGWATTTAYTARSTNSGNVESVTVTNTAAGYRYISLYAKAAFSGVTVTAKY